MRIIVPLLAALLVPAAAAITRPEALALLKSATQRYADAKSYHIEAVQERTSSNELSRQWEKELLVAVGAPDGKYRYEGRSGHGSAILVSDGKTHWTYHLNEHLYTQTSTTNTEKNRIIPMEEYVIMSAKALVADIEGLSVRVKSATLLPDQVIEWNGRKVKCYVIHIGTNDLKTRQADATMEETLWIKQSTKTILKRQRREESYLFLSSKTHLPMHIETTILYPVVRLGEPEPPSSFAFTPPADAKLVESFPPIPFADHAGADFVGKQAPELLFKGADGKLTKLSTFRGKPVFIEFWATWCAPCVELMPDLKQLYSETSTSVVWLSIDNDEDPGAATTYLAQEHIAWPNYHDEDGALGKAFDRVGIPLAVVIDAEGKVAFYKAGYDFAELRAAIAKLSPSASGTPQSK